MKKIGVLFSGGLDSTYLIRKNLKEGNEVHPIYIEIENNRSKTILEKNRMELIWDKLSKEFNNDGNLLCKINNALKVEVNSHGGGLMFKQIPIWLFGALFQQGKHLDEIHIGYVMNDDAISYIDDILKIYKSYQIIVDDKLIPLKFPLIKMDKCRMASKLGLEYVRLTYSCEDPRIVGSEDAEVIDYEPCCSCPACKKIIGTDYYGSSKMPENYKTKILDEYARKLSYADYKITDSEGKDYMNKFGFEAKARPYQLEIPFGDEDNYTDDCKSEEIEEVDIEIEVEK